MYSTLLVHKTSRLHCRLHSRIGLVLIEESDLDSGSLWLPNDGRCLSGPPAPDRRGRRGTPGYVRLNFQAQLVARIVEAKNWAEYGLVVADPHLVGVFRRPGAARGGGFVAGSPRVG